MKGRKKVKKEKREKGKGKKDSKAENPICHILVITWRRGGFKTKRDLNFFI